MSNTIPTIQIREWCNITPSDNEHGDVLRKLPPLTDDDWKLLDRLKNRIKVSKVDNGLDITTNRYIGTVTLSRVCIEVVPKIPIENLMAMMAYAYDLSDIQIAESSTRFDFSDTQAAESRTHFEHGTTGIVDLLGLMLLQAVSHLARGGLLPNYEERTEDLSTLRGRLDMRYIATHPHRTTLRCTYEDLTLDHTLNQTLAAGLRFAARVMVDRELCLDLKSAANRFFGDFAHIKLEDEVLRRCIETLSRSSSHYRAALTLVQLIHRGARLDSHEHTLGEMPLPSFLLNMDEVFERFLERHLREHVPKGIEVSGQERTKVFHYRPGAPWTKPRYIQPDLIFRRHGEVLAIADAKYKNLLEHQPNQDEPDGPGRADLHQLTVYGLAYEMPEPRNVLLMYPLSTDDAEQQPATLVFQIPNATNKVLVHLVGVPVDAILDGTKDKWLPMLLREQLTAQDSAA